MFGYTLSNIGEVHSSLWLASLADLEVIKSQTIFSCELFKMQSLTLWSVAIRFPKAVRHKPLHAVAYRMATTATTASLATTVSIASTTNTVQDDQTISLPDGRDVGFAEYGSPTGYPLFYFHGFPSSRLEARGLDDIGRRHNIHVVAIDRPGFGLSTFQPNRRITDFPADVQFLAQQLGFRRFAVLGGSGGGPYALACANAIPPETLSAVGMMASAAPWEAGTQDVLLSARLTSWAATHCPSVLIGLTDTLISLLKKGLNTNAGKKIIDRVVEKAAAQANKEIPKGQDEATIEERRNRTLRIGFEGFAQGSRGFVHEAYILTHFWGFRLEDVRFNKVLIWHGTKDKNSPIRMVRYMHERLPHSHLTEHEGDNHFAISRHLEEIITELIPEEEKKQYCRNNKA